MTKINFQKFQTPLFQELIIFFTIVYVSLMLVLQYKQSYFAEENYEVAKVEKKAQRLATKVETGLYINNFPTFSFYKNNFTMDAIIWFQFPVGTESLSTIEKFNFKNGTIISKSAPIIKMAGNNVTIIFHIVAELITILNYKHFPVSDHKLTIILQNKSISASELYFSSDEKNLELSNNLLTGNWIPSNNHVDTGFVKTEFKKGEEVIETGIPSVVFTVDFKNENLRNFIILYLPLFLIFFLIFASLLTRIDNIGIRLPIVASVVPILALHSLVIESMSPTGSNITKVDQIYLTLIGLSLIILLVQAYIGLFVKNIGDLTKEKQKQRLIHLKKANDFVILLVLTTLIISLTYSTFS
jgi:hypothetical protein